MTTLELRGTTPAGTIPATRPGIALVRVHDALWRVTRKSGEVLGYVEQFGDQGGVRYRAKRMIAKQQRFVPLGEFWTAEEAVDCFG